MEPESRIERRSLKFRYDAADIVSGTLGWSDAAGDDFRMSKHLIYIALLFIVVIAAVQTTNAQSISVELAEKTPPVDPGDPTLAGPPPTTTTTTTLPTIPRCPDGVDGATAGAQNGYDYWAFDDAQSNCPVDTTTHIYCFENPQVDLTRSDTMDWESIKGFFGPFNYNTGIVTSFKGFAAQVIGVGPDHPETCYICGCFREIGCFPPGVKITMADGSLRNIEDVRAGDTVRNAKTGAAIKVRQVIEGPEALPLIRFGFDGTTVTTSQAHPVLTAAGLKPANQLKKGDTIFDARGHPRPLTILETLPLEEGQRVINVDLEAASSDTDKRLLISDGIITGDIVLQGLLKARK
jgi:hypothetical protein